MVFKATPMAVPSADPPLANERLPHTPLSSPHTPPVAAEGCSNNSLTVGHPRLVRWVASVRISESARKAASINWRSVTRGSGSSPPLAS